eukprot:364805-Chlamydomonas_euryale.AAC.1
MPKYGVGGLVRLGHGTERPAHHALAAATVASATTHDAARLQHSTQRDLLLLGSFRVGIGASAAGAPFE